jgi:hypothetical protein
MPVRSRRVQAGCEPCRARRRAIVERYLRFQSKTAGSQEVAIRRSSAPRSRWLDCCTPPTHNVILMLFGEKNKTIRRAPLSSGAIVRRRFHPRFSRADIRPCARWHLVGDASSITLPLDFSPARERQMNLNTRRCAARQDVGAAREELPIRPVIPIIEVMRRPALHR